MKLLKILLILITFSSVSNAEIIKNVSFDKNQDTCIYDTYFVHELNYYAQELGSNQWYSGSAIDGISFIKSGYQYDTDTSICSLESLEALGLEEKEFNFLMGLSGLTFSSIIFYIIASFLVGM